MDRPVVSQGLISRFAKLTFILLIKCFNAIKFTVTQERMLGVMSSKLMTFIHFFDLKKKKKGQFGIIQQQYSRSFQSKHLQKDGWFLYWREMSSRFSSSLFPFSRRRVDPDALNVLNCISCLDSSSGWDRNAFMWQLALITFIDF